MVKVEANRAVQPKSTMKDARGSDEKWKLTHLGVNKLDEDKFTNAVAPCARKKAGALDPWANLSINDIKAIVDEVYGPGVHELEVTADGPWVGLVRENFGISDNLLTTKGQCSIAQLAWRVWYIGVGYHRHAHQRQ